MKTKAKRGAPQKYTDTQHYLIRALILLREYGQGEHTIPTEHLVRMVGPLADGKPVPAATIKMVTKDAIRVLDRGLGLDKYFARTSQSKRYSKEAK